MVTFSASPSAGRRGTGLGRSPRVLRHPLPPEVLVAELAGELPPSVARAVRTHVAECASCGERAHRLAIPYDLLAGLGSEPVPFVPDLRYAVREQLEHAARFDGVVASLGRIGRVALALGIAVCGLVLLFVLVAVLVILRGY
jgi:anti-sigma factor RsiW